jgi:hypothetical protein
LVPLCRQDLEGNQADRFLDIGRDDIVGRAPRGYLVAGFLSPAVIAIENARLLNELRQRTDDLSEALEQQTATSEVLQVISSSPGELKPVFEAMLANAVRICGASFGNLLLYEGDAFRRVAVHNAPPAWVADHQRDPFVPRRSGAQPHGAKGRGRIWPMSAASSRALMKSDR